VTEGAAPIGYFYCSRDEAASDRGNPAKVLSTIIQQIIAADQTAANGPVFQKYLTMQDEGIERDLDFEECIDLIIELSNKNPATIVLDGLDECRYQDISHSHMLKELQRITTSAKNNIKIFIASRNDSDIKKELLKHPNLWIDARDNKQDIEIFVEREVGKAVEAWVEGGNGEMPSDLQNKIKETLIGRADGM